MSDHADDMRRELFNAVQTSLDCWQAILEAFEGFVSRAKSMGWSDEQARAMVFPQIMQMAASIGTKPQP